MKLDGVDMVRKHNDEFRHVRNVKLIEKRKNRDKRFFKIEAILMCSSAILLLNDSISMKQMFISGTFAVAGIATDLIRRYV